ncbi:MAG: hypothetical protein ACI970_001520 [Myxococcota bacterium]|jgi:hypothetical protein
MRLHLSSETARGGGWTPAWAGLLLLLTTLAGPAAAAPLDVQPAPEGASGVEVTPALVRVPLDGRTTVVVSVGADATDDLLLRFVLRTVEVTLDGITSGGAPVSLENGAVTTDAIRLAPGEQVLVPVTVVNAPAIFEAAARPADDLDGDVVAVQSLLLPGSPDATPALAISVGPAVSESADGDASTTTSATVVVTSPTVLSLRVNGAGATTLLSRLVLPSQPLVVPIGAASWPRSTTAVITTEGGSVVRAATGRTALLWLAGLAFALALATLAASASAVRRTPRGAATEPDAPNAPDAPVG